MPDLPLNRRRWLGLAASGLGAALTANGSPSRAADDEVQELPGRIFASSTGMADDRFNGTRAIDPNSGGWSRVVRTTSREMRVSPDGRTIAYVRYEGEGKYSSWVLGLSDDRGPIRVLDGQGVFAWSPDGKQLAIGVVVGSRPQRTETWRVNADGTGRVKLPIPETEYLQDWSPDGRWMLTKSSRRVAGAAGRTVPMSKYPVYAMHPDGTGERLIWHGDPTPSPRGARPSGAWFFGPRFAPDSRRIVHGFSPKVDEGPAIGLWQTDIDGAEPRCIVAGTPEESLAYAAWSPDGKWLAAPLSIRDQPDATPRFEAVVIADSEGKHRRDYTLVPVPNVFWISDWRDWVF